MAIKNEKWGRKFLAPEPVYPHERKIQLNVLYILSIVSALDPVKSTLTEKRKSPENGFIIPYPHPEFIELTYISILKELLIETAVFIRGHDDFWGKKSGKKWSELVKDKCGTTRFVGTNVQEEPIDLDLRTACNKLIHSTHLDFGYEGDKKNLCFILNGEHQNKQWQAFLYLEDFCYVALRLMFPSL